MKSENLPKYTIGSLVLVVYIGASVWLVRAEGDRYRRELRETGPQASESPMDSGQQAPAPVAPAGAAQNAGGPVASDSPPEFKEPQNEAVTGDDGANAQADAETDEDFDLDNHVVFPGLSP